MSKRVAAGLGDVGRVAIVLLRCPHDLRLRRPRKPPWPRGRSAPRAAAGAGARIAGGGACSHLSSPCGLPYAIEFQTSRAQRRSGERRGELKLVVRTRELGRARPGRYDESFIHTPLFFSTISLPTLIQGAPHASVGINLLR